MPIEVIYRKEQARPLTGEEMDENTKKIVAAIEESTSKITALEAELEAFKTRQLAMPATGEAAAAGPINNNDPMKLKVYEASTLPTDLTFYTVAILAPTNSFILFNPESKKWVHMDGTVVAVS